MELQIKVTVGFLNWLGENFKKKNTLLTQPFENKKTAHLPFEKVTLILLHMPVVAYVLKLFLSRRPH